MKKESAGFDRRTTLVRLVAAGLLSGLSQYIVVCRAENSKPTFVALPLDLNFLGQVFILFPPDWAANSPLIQIIAFHIKVVAVPILFGEDRVFKVFVLREM